MSYIQEKNNIKCKGSGEKKKKFSRWRVRLGGEVKSAEVQHIWYVSLNFGFKTETVYDLIKTY